MFYLLLIRPFYPERSTFNGFEPASLGVLAALTPSENWRVDIVDESYEDIPYEKDYDLVGISVITSLAPHVYKMADVFRAKNVSVILGGFHPSSVPDEAKTYSDSVVVGLAEEKWLEVISDFEKGALKEEYHASVCDVFVTPDRSRFRDNYLFSLVSTSRGCSQQCSFCAGHIVNGKRNVERPVADVIKELKSLKGKLVFFSDDNFFGLSNNRIGKSEELLNEMIKQNINVHWFAFASVNIIDDEEFLKLLKKAGCRMLFLGIEVDKVELLSKIRKRNIKKHFGNICNGIKLIHKYGIAVHSNFILGIPGDTSAMIYSRINKSLSLGLDYVTYTALTPLPGTPLYEQEEFKLKSAAYPESWGKYDFSRLFWNATDSNAEQNIFEDFELRKRFKTSYKLRLIYASFFKTGSLKTTAFYYFLRAAYDSRLLNYTFHRKLFRRILN